MKGREKQRDATLKEFHTKRIQVSSTFLLVFEIQKTGCFSFLNAS